VLNALISHRAYGQELVCSHYTFLTEQTGYQKSALTTKRSSEQRDFFFSEQKSAAPTEQKSAGLTAQKTRRCASIAQAPQALQSAPAVLNWPCKRYILRPL